MKTPEVSCPRCNSLQKLARRKRKTSLPLEGVLEVYISCNMCQWERRIEYTTREMERLKLRRARAGRMALREHERNGQVSDSTRKMVMRVVRETARLRQDLDKRVQSAQPGGSSAQ